VRVARIRPGVCLVLALVAVLAGGTRQAAAVSLEASTSPTALTTTAPLSPSPGTLLTFSVVVSPGTNPTSTGLYVNCDLSWLGLGSSAPLYDDGTNGDPTAGDLTFTVQADIPSGTMPSTRNGTCSVFDAESRAGSTSYSVTVVPSVTDVGPTVTSTDPLSDATDVAKDANVTITFSEAVDTAGSWYAISCASSGAHTASVTGGPQSYLLIPASDFAAGELCTVTLTAADVTDQDTLDPPDAMASDYEWSFTTAAAPPSNEPPSVSGGGPYSIDEGSSATVTASGNDPEAGPLQYAWDLDNDGTFETAGQTAAFSAVAIDGPATRTIAVLVTDDGGLTATDTATVTVANVLPTATFDPPASSPAGFPFTLSLTSAHDPSAADTGAGLEYAFDCGSGYGAFGGTASAACPTTDVGVPSVGAKIRDKDGGVSEYRGAVSVFVTFSSLCDLVRAYSTDPKVADDLCEKLARADTAQTAGSREGSLGAFAGQVDAKTDKGLTPPEAAELKLLLGRL
jgi:Bacterial Ig-like domain